MVSFLSSAVSCLLAAVTLDLSQYAMDVGKAVASKCGWVGGREGGREQDFKEVAGQS